MANEIYLNPFPKRQILDLSMLKELQITSFSLDGNGKKDFKAIENIVCLKQ